jgi:hypothetical protein
MPTEAKKRAGKSDGLDALRSTRLAGGRVHPHL